MPPSEIFFSAALRTLCTDYKFSEEACRTLAKVHTFRSATITIFDHLSRPPIAQFRSHVISSLPNPNKVCPNLEHLRCRVPRLGCVVPLPSLLHLSLAMYDGKLHTQEPVEAALSALITACFALRTVRSYCLLGYTH